MATSFLWFSGVVIVKMNLIRSDILLTWQFGSSFTICVYFSYLIAQLLLYLSETSGTSTVKPYDKFDLEKDVDTIHEIAKTEAKYIPDVDKVVRMICHRCRKQRLEMKELFRQKYKKEIDRYCYNAAGAEISFGDLLEDCFHTELEIYKHHLHRELTSKFKGLDKEAIVEILLSIPPEKKEEFLQSYNETYRKTAQEDANFHLMEDFKNIIIEMLKRNRSPDISPEKIDCELAKKEAQLIHDGRKKWDDHRGDLDRILLETPIQQLNAVFVEFKKINGKELDEVFDKHMEKGKRGSYKSMVFFAKNKHDYYARRLQKAMKGLGTKDHTINRIMTIHSEDDIVEIATAFQLNTADSLIDALESETMQHQQMLLACFAGKPILKENF